MKKVLNAVRFDSNYVTVDGGSVFVRFDFGEFYEWYKLAEKTFSLLNITESQKLEKSFNEYESSRRPNIIHLGEMCLK